MSEKTDTIPATLSEADARVRLAALGFSDDAIDGFFRDPRQAATAFANYTERRHDRQKAAAAILHALVAGRANTPKREPRPHHTTEGPAHHRAALVLEAYCWDDLAAELRAEMAAGSAALAEARRDVARLSALRSAEVAPVLERFVAAMGQREPPPLTEASIDMLLSEATAIAGMRATAEMKRAAFRGSLAMVNAGRPALTDVRPDTCRCTTEPCPDERGLCIVCGGRLAAPEVPPC